MAGITTSSVEGSVDGMSADSGHGADATAVDDDSATVDDSASVKTKFMIVDCRCEVEGSKRFSGYLGRSLRAGSLVQQPQCLNDWLDSLSSAVKHGGQETSTICTLVLLGRGAATGDDGEEEDVLAELARHLRKRAVGSVCVVEGGFPAVLRAVYAAGGQELLDEMIVDSRGCDAWAAAAQQGLQQTQQPPAGPPVASRSSGLANGYDGPGATAQSVSQKCKDDLAKIDAQVQMRAKSDQAGYAATLERLQLSPEMQRNKVAEAEAVEEAEWEELCEEDWVSLEAKIDEELEAMDGTEDAESANEPGPVQGVQSGDAIGDEDLACQIDAELEAMEAEELEDGPELAALEAELELEVFT
jgi:hypothetical protein